jgi:hypothetical protein
LILLFVLLPCLEVRSQARYEFGFSLNPTAQGALYGLFLYTVVDGQVVGSVPMRMLPFFLQASGMEESRVNLEMLDLFAEHGIAGCGPLASSMGATSDMDCLPMKDLWKLRYQDGMGVAAGMGWAADPMRPSERQQIILQHYRSPHHTHWHGPRSLFRVSCRMAYETVFCSGEAEKWKHSGAYVTIFRRSMSGKEAGGRV